MNQITTDVLVVGGGVGGTAAAIQAARMGAQVTLVSEFAWLGGMLTTAGVTAPDGNELDAWRTGLWGAFLTELIQRHPEGLDNGWVSFFTYAPRVGAEVFADWVKALPNLTWIQHETPQSVLREGDRILGVRFQNHEILATITIDGTELGDLLALGEIPHRWGWEFQAEFNEPSAPKVPNATTSSYPVQAPTWVVVMQDFGPGTTAPLIPAPSNYDPTPFNNAWKNYGPEKCLDYGRLPGDRFMINWPIHGNDYGEGVERLVGNAADRAAFLEEARQYSQGFAHYIQSQVDRRYGLAEGTFDTPQSAFAFHPYYRESRRLIGLTTIREQDLLPMFDGQTAALPITTSASGCDNVEQCCDAIAIGNYANDHHYPSGDIPLAPKSIRWGGRWTGTPFTIPYRSLVPATIDGFLACEKNISTSHMSNGATRLQPCVFGIGQAAGAAAALCVDRSCQPRDLPINALQTSLLTDPIAPNAIIPLFNLPPHHPDWLQWQRYYLEHCGSYPRNAYAPSPIQAPSLQQPTSETFSGQFLQNAPQDYSLAISPQDLWQLVTTDAAIDAALSMYKIRHKIQLIGRKNAAGRWILVEAILS
jgi:FAD dependent oxidoreductase